MSASEERMNIQRVVVDRLADMLRDTPYAPPEGGLITEAVIVVAWLAPDGDYGRTWLASAPSWVSEGLLAQTLRDVQAAADEADEVEDDVGGG